MKKRRNTIKVVKIEGDFSDPNDVMDAVLKAMTTAHMESTVDEYGLNVALNAAMDASGLAAFPRETIDAHNLTPEQKAAFEASTPRVIRDVVLDHIAQCLESLREGDSKESDEKAVEDLIKETGGGNAKG